MQLKPYTKLLAESWAEFNKDIQNYLLIALISGLGVYWGFITDFVGMHNLASQLIRVALYIVFVMLGLLAILSKVDDKSKQLSVSESYARAKQHFGTVFGTYFLIFLLVILGFIALIIPGVILSVMFVFVIPVALFEHKFYMEAAKRSMYYVKGYWWHVFGRFLFIAVVVGLPIGIIGSVLNEIVGKNYSLFIQDFLNILALPLVIIFDYLLYKEFVQLKSQTETETQTALSQAEHTIAQDPNAEQVNSNHQQN